MLGIGSIVTQATQILKAYLILADGAVTGSPDCCSKNSPTRPSMVPGGMGRDHPNGMTNITATSARCVGCALVAFSCKTEAPRRWPTDTWTKVSQKISIDFLISLLLATSSWSCWAWSLRFILEFGSVGFAFCIIVLYQYMSLPLAASACTPWFELVKLWFSTRYAWVWNDKKFPWSLLTA